MPRSILFFIAAPFLLRIALSVAHAALIFLRVGPISPSPRRLSNNLMASSVNPPSSPLNVDVVSPEDTAPKRKRRAVGEFLVEGDSDDDQHDLPETLEFPCSQCVNRLISRGQQVCRPGAGEACEPCRKNKNSCHWDHDLLAGSAKLRKCVRFLLAESQDSKHIKSAAVPADPATNTKAKKARFTEHFLRLCKSYRSARSAAQQNPPTVRNAYESSPSGDLQSSPALDVSNVLVRRTSQGRRQSNNQILPVLNHFFDQQRLITAGISEMRRDFANLAAVHARRDADQVAQTTQLTSVLTQLANSLNEKGDGGEDDGSFSDGLG